MGDSIAEEHFVALLCLAWAENIPVDGPYLVKERAANDGEWRATVGGMTNISFFKTPSPGTKSFIDYSTPEVLFIGGHTHLCTHPKAVSAFYLQSTTKEQVARESNATPLPALTQR